MAQVPMRMAQPGLVPHQQRPPPMMVSMTQPPPSSMQGIATMSPMMGHGGGMAVMPQTINHPDSGHDHHSMNGPYHHHHPHHPPPPRQQTHPPPLHPNGPQSTQYHHHGPPHGGPHSVHHSIAHNHSNPHPGPHSTSNGPGSHNAHGIHHIQSGGPLNQPSHTMTHNSGPHQMNGLPNPTMNSHHPHLPPISSQQHHLNHCHQSMHHTLPPQSQQQPLHPQTTLHCQQGNSHQQPIVHSLNHNNSGGIVILNNPNNSHNQNIKMAQNENNTVLSNSITTINATVNGLSDSSDVDVSHNVDLAGLTREKTPMCLVNELARYNKIQHQYCLTDEKGPAHKKLFTVTLHMGDNEESYSASGASIKKAQHLAAATALEKTKFANPPPKTQRLNKQSKLTPTVELNAVAMKRGEAAIYTFLETPRPPFAYRYNMPPNIRAVYGQKYYGRPMYPKFFVSLKVGVQEFMGEGVTAQQAKHNAASKALKTLKSIILPGLTTPIPPLHTADVTELVPNAELKSPVSLVHEIALKRNYVVTFEVVRESGPPHMRSFVTTCIVGDIRTQGEGTGKKISKKRSAEFMLEELRKLPPVPNGPIARMKRKPLTKKKGRNLIKEQKAAPDYGQGINPISRLIQIQQAKKEKEPVYTLLAERGVPRRREFVIQVTVGSSAAQGSGPNKKLAKRAAAENMLQLLGYSRPQPQPGKPALKMEGGHSEPDKTRKVTFSEESSDSVQVICQPSVQNQNISSGGGRQLVPGLIMMSDNMCTHNNYQTMQQPGMNNVAHINQMVNMQATAAIAKELLESGNSPTAKALNQGNGSQSSTLLSQPVQPHHQPLLQKTPPDHSPQPQQQQQQQQLHSPPQAQVQPLQPPAQSSNNNSTNQPRSCFTISGSTCGQAVRPKDQLMYLASILNLQIQFTDFPKGNKSEFLSLVSLSTIPPHVSHGSGTTIDASHDQACLTALKTLAEMGLDTVTSDNRES